MIMARPKKNLNIIHHTHSQHRHRSPLVILVGWMGSQPRQLQRLQSLYEERNGCQVVCTVTPTPTMVFRACLPPRPPPPAVNKQQSQSQQQQQQQGGFVMHVPPSWPYDSYLHHHHATTTTATSIAANVKNNGNAKSMQELAWIVLAEMDQAAATSSPGVFFHVCSNAGCFLWEQVCRILQHATAANATSNDDNNDNNNNSNITDNNNQRLHEGSTNSASDAATAGENVIPEPVRQRLSRIKSKVLGVVFDSCPGLNLAMFPKALEYCTTHERLQVWLAGGADYAFFNRSSTIQARIQKRQEEYQRYLQNNTWDLPQLYLYSANDQLAPVQGIEEVMHCRRQRAQLLVGGQKRGRDEDGIINAVRWETSAHCAHLLRHPNDYQKAVTDFVQTNLLKQQPLVASSRL